MLGMTMDDARKLLEDPLANQVFTLPSGVCVGVVECGDPKGFPVFWFTGNMGPAITVLLYNDIARRHRLRIICPDRPGYNFSEDMYSEGRPNTAEYATLVNDLATHMRIAQFSLAAFSLGAVYAFAFAKLYPHRLKGPMHLISPWLSTSTPGASRFFRNIARFVPSVIIRTTLITMPQVVEFFDANIGSMGAVNIGEGKPDSELGLLPSPGRQLLYHTIHSVAIANLRNGNMGPHYDWMVAFERVPWGFRYQDVDYPVKIFVGDKDEEVPLESWLNMSHKMKNMHARIVEDSGHYLLLKLDFMDEVFETIAYAVRVAEGKSGPSDSDAAAPKRPMRPPLSPPLSPPHSPVMTPPRSPVGEKQLPSTPPRSPMRSTGAQPSPVTETFRSNNQNYGYI